MYSPFIPVHINCTPEIKNVIQIIVNKPSDGLVKVIDFTTIIINNTNAVKRNNKPNYKSSYGRNCNYCTNRTIKIR